MPLEKLDPTETISSKKALRHLIVFQFKLLADALRDLIFSPISFFACIIDLVRGPTVKDSLSYRLMLAGRRSDRLINLFDEFHDSEDYTIDETVKDVENLLVEQFEKKRKPRD